MDQPPELVYRRLNFPLGIAPEYHWTAKSTPELFETGGAGTQHMTFHTWCEVIQREAASGSGTSAPPASAIFPGPNTAAAAIIPITANPRAPT